MIRCILYLLLHHIHLTPPQSATFPSSTLFLLTTVSTASTTMSSPFIKRARSKQSVRSRDVDGEDAQGTGSPLANDVTAASSSRRADDDEPLGSVLQSKMKKRKEKKAGGSSRLSFGGDGDEVRYREVAAQRI